MSLLSQYLHSFDLDKAMKHGLQYKTESHSGSRVRFVAPEHLGGYKATLHAVRSYLALYCLYSHSTET